jgi:hypothetical protein
MKLLQYHAIEYAEIKPMINKRVQLLLASACVEILGNSRNETDI